MGMIIVLFSIACLKQEQAEPAQEPKKAPKVSKEVTSQQEDDKGDSDSYLARKLLPNYSLGEVVSKKNLVVIPILTSIKDQYQQNYLSLNEALESKLLVVKEVEGGGNVPVIEVISKSDKPVFLPFGGIISGGNQDRMIREDVVLKPKQTRKVPVYCIEQGRWAASTTGENFTANRQMGSLALKSISNVSAGQGRIWSNVAGSNAAFSNTIGSGNFQGNALTPAFKKLAGEFKDVDEKVKKQTDTCGTIVILNGKVIGLEIFASKNYFKKTWPQLFQSYIIDIPSEKNKVEIDAAKAKKLAQDYLKKIRKANITQKTEESEIRFKIEDKECLGYALVEKKKGRLAYLRFFPKVKKKEKTVNAEDRGSSVIIIE
jgi:hypothetical protein